MQIVYCFICQFWKVFFPISLDKATYKHKVVLTIGVSTCGGCQRAPPCSWIWKKQCPASQDSQAQLFQNQQPSIKIEKSTNAGLISLGFLLTDLSTVKFYLLKGTPMPSNILCSVFFRCSSRQVWWKFPSLTSPKVKQTKENLTRLWTPQIRSLQSKFSILNA